jgi:ribosomal-protein-alanine N-acetyltransferase
VAALTTARLALRPFRPDDTDQHYLSLVSRPEVAQYLPGGKPGSPAQAEAVTTYFADHWGKHGYGVWVVSDASGAMVGRCGLNYVAERDCVEVLYAYAPEFWGCGYATEAAEAAVRYGFEVTGLASLCGFVVPANEASARVLTKVGMRRRGPLQIFGLATDEYCLERSDWSPG